MAISRTDLEAMDRDELIEYVLEQDRRMADLEAELSDARADAAKDRAQIRARISDLEEELQGTIADAVDRQARERSKDRRRLSALEDEVGITATDALATAEAGADGEHLTTLGRLIRHGPEAVSENPGATLYRARELVDNWNDWGTIRDDALGKERRLASKKHRLKTHLESKLDERLDWRQVYRAMEWVERNSGESVSLTEGSQDEGKYVLVHKVEETE